MGKNDSTQTVQQNADPWGPATGELQRVLSNAARTFNNSQFAPRTYQSATGNSTYAGVSPETNQALARMSAMSRDPGNTAGLTGAYQSMANMAQGGMNQPMQHALGGLGQMMNAGPVTTYQDMSQEFGAARDAALADAIPAAAAMFSGSGMGNSSQAMAGVGRAATEAVAPIHYQAAQAAMDRDIAAQESALNRNMQAAGAIGALGNEAAMQQLRAGGLLPAAYGAQYTPAQMQGQVGGVIDAHNQAVRDADVNRFYQQENRTADNLRGLASLVLPVSGQGGTSSSQQTTPGPSFGQQAGGALLGGLGTYGALASNPVTAPFALLGGIGSGLLGLF